MEGPEVKVYMAKNKVTASFEDTSGLHVFYVEIGKRFQAGYQVCLDDWRENLTIYSGSKDTDALISGVMTRGLTLLRNKHRSICRAKAYSIVRRYYMEIRQYMDNPARIREIVRNFRSEVLRILGMG